MSLNQLLEKLGIKYEDLTDEEKQTYENWSNVLTTPDVTIDDLKKFLPVYIAQLQQEQNDYQNNEKKDLYLKACIRNAQMIQAFILGPEKQREWLQNNINKLKNG
jgi:hypothetical protein